MQAELAATSGLGMVFATRYHARVDPKKKKALIGLVLALVAGLSAVFGANVVRPYLDAVEEAGQVAEQAEAMDASSGGAGLESSGQ